jgi:NAD(P)-dependent dehydrogenase (short-subunit alcohol dehydrogenase family)
VDLKGKVCLVTGGNSGIGASTALLLAQRGAHVATLSRTGIAERTDFFSTIENHGTTVRYLKGDVADPAVCRDRVNQVVRDFGRLDVLVHSAGGSVMGGLHDVSDEDWMKAFAVHLHAVFHLARAAAPHMEQQRGGAIILLSSAAGLRGCLGALAYGVAKGALPQFARSLARELADHNIRVNCVSPGIIRTPFQAHLSPEQATNNIKNRVPLHKEGSPDDVASLIVSLVENDFITGENFVIDGGMTMRIV